jgi:hypothetical protein
MSPSRPSRPTSSRGEVMTALSPGLLLETWARARHGAPAERAAALLEAAHPTEGLEALPVGVRDRILLGLFEENFGSKLNGTGTCDACGTMVELGIDVQLLTAHPIVEEAPVVEIEGAPATLRPPTVADVLAAADSAAPSRCLAARCLGRTDEATLDDDDVRRIGEALLAADPLLDPEIGVVCPECGASQAFGLDVAGFLWERVEARAERLMGEVHLLARAYGWSEREILALPAARRAVYLSMVTA